MVHWALDFQLLDKPIDDEGKYVILLCKSYQLNGIIAAIYVPPPFSLEVLRILLTYHMGHPGVPPHRCRGSKLLHGSNSG